MTSGLPCEWYERPPIVNICLNLMPKLVGSQQRSNWYARSLRRRIFVCRLFIHDWTVNEFDDQLLFLRYLVRIIHRFATVHLRYGNTNRLRTDSMPVR